MGPEERLRRIRRKNMLRLTAPMQTREDFLREVEAALADAGAGLSLRKIAQSLGMAHQTLGEMLGKCRLDDEKAG